MLDIAVVLERKASDAQLQKAQNYLGRDRLSHGKKRECQIGKSVPIRFHLFCLSHLVKLQAYKTCAYVST